MLVGEVEDLRKMMESLKRMVTGQGLEEKRGETGDQEASLEEAEEKEKEKSVGEKTRENSSTDNKDGKRIRPGAQMIAQTCAPHEKAFSILRINFRILQSFSVV